MSVSLEIRATGNAVAALAKADERLADLTPLHAEIGASLLASTQQRFQDGKAPDGGPWPASVRALLTGGKTLVDTAFLSRSITHQADPQAARVGTNAIYAAIHQTGGTIRAKTAKGLRFRPAGGDGLVVVKSVRIPARPFLGVSAEDEREVIAIAEEFIAEALDAG